MPLNLKTAIGFCALAVFILQDGGTNKDKTEKPENTKSKTAHEKTMQGSREAWQDDIFCFIVPC